MAKFDPLVSIGLPVYNGGLYLAEAIESLLGQTFRDFELIISDNGSSDKTQSICERYASRDPRVRYYREEENLGCAWNYNRVFELSRGKYFKWAADDDIHLPTFLAKTVEALDQNPEVLWCFCRHSHVGPDGQFLSGPSNNDASFLDPNGSDRTSSKPHQRFQSILLAHSGLDMYAIIRRDAFERTKGFQSIYGAEKVLVGELALLGKYHEIPETLFQLRVHPKASSSLNSEAELQQFVDPKAKRRFPLMRLRLLKAHWANLHRHPLGFVERARCYLVLMRYLLQVSKWKRILVSSLRKQGIGGGYLPALEEIEKESQSTNENTLTPTTTQSDQKSASDSCEQTTEHIKC
ncbi:MAG: glycosyltransferase family 2 protein [Planctomycetes bacterium]|nr:glycosyltransferase family 2 protein [Planctomycetota bacterium]